MNKTKEWATLCTLNTFSIITEDLFSPHRAAGALTLCLTLLLYAKPHLYTEPSDFFPDFQIVIISHLRKIH